MKNEFGDKTISEITSEHFTYTKILDMERWGVLSETTFLMPTVEGDARYVMMNHKNSYITPDAQRYFEEASVYGMIKEEEGFDKGRVKPVNALLRYDGSIYIADGQQTSGAAYVCSQGTLELPTLLNINPGRNKEECEYYEARPFININGSVKPVNFAGKYKSLLTIGKREPMLKDAKKALKVQEWLNICRLDYKDTTNSNYYPVDGISKISSFFKSTKIDLLPHTYLSGMMLGEVFRKCYGNINNPPPIQQVMIEGLAITLHFLEKRKCELDRDILSKSLLKSLKSFKAKIDKYPQQQKQWLKDTPRGLADSRKDYAVIGLHMLIRYNEFLKNEGNPVISQDVILTHFQETKYLEWITKDDLKEF